MDVYNGPERRGLMAEAEEKRQTNEVAIARLEVNVEYIKEQLKTMNEALCKALNNNCTDCATAKALQAHIDSGWDKWKFYLSGAISLGALIIALFKKG